MTVLPAVIQFEIDRLHLVKCSDELTSF